MPRNKDFELVKGKGSERWLAKAEDTGKRDLAASEAVTMGSAQMLGPVAGLRPGLSAITGSWPAASGCVCPELWLLRAKFLHWLL